MSDRTEVARRLDRAALERVLARAAELQLASDPSDPHAELTEAQIVELGREVGLAPDHLRQAIAEERTRVAVAPESGVAASVLGPGRVHATRTVPGKAAAVAAAIDAWMQNEEGMRVKRHLGERMLFEPRRDMLGQLRRAFNVGGRSYALTRAEEVTSTVLQVDAARSLVTLDADLTPQRGRLAVQSALAGTGGVTAAAILTVLGVMVPVAIIPAVAVPSLAVYTARQVQHRSTVRAQLALEQLLDRLERGSLPTTPPSLLGAISAAAAALPRRL